MSDEQSVCDRNEFHITSIYVIMKSGIMKTASTDMCEMRLTHTDFWPETIKVDAIPMNTSDHICSARNDGTVGSNSIGGNVLFRCIV